MNTDIIEAIVDGLADVVADSTDNKGCRRIFQVLGILLLIGLIIWLIYEAANK